MHCAGSHAPQRSYCAPWRVLYGMPQNTVTWPCLLRVSSCIRLHVAARHVRADCEHRRCFAMQLAFAHPYSVSSRPCASDLLRQRMSTLARRARQPRDARPWRAGAL